MATKSRIKAAIEFLKDNQSFRVDHLHLGVNELQDVEVTGLSLCANFRDLTKSRCLEELNEVEISFSEMVNMSPELKKFIEGKSIKFDLWFDNYGKSSIGICSKRNGVLHWEANIES